MALHNQGNFTIKVNLRIQREFIGCLHNARSLGCYSKFTNCYNLCSIFRRNKQSTLRPTQKLKQSPKTFFPWSMGTRTPRTHGQALGLDYSGRIPNCNPKSPRTCRTPQEPQAPIRSTTPMPPTPPWYILALDEHV